jgi:hypothetical protein
MPLDSMVRVRVDRIVTPGPVPDLVSLTFLGGGLQTWTTAGIESRVSLKLIVYPDVATANADSTLLSGAGSAFVGAVTLIGATGALIPELGFVAGDWIVQDNGGQFTARPITELSKVASVPDANAAVVTLVADPRSEPAPITQTGVPGASASSGLWLGPAVPNPARGETRFRFAIPRPGQVTLGIYDQQGRRVRELVHGRLPAGEHEARWDGHDIAGRQAPSAIYFYRLEVDGRRLAGKILTVR